ncbi:hypothetical protein Rsub_03382 [Raphidocelis subcapitata]|uniref:Fanconi anemia group I protein n=1 Tax=Raphidocelis subcapitata TaxID=307507 RepID=A0A2V0NSE5_9CHLO|nr:hypothetical protein Rsub_03382 [Raphidocelis subcapitata]|eukprot:GBF90249.1 hypothetical protein Rsub_03382 [Raphidocelis subcapitata]
MGMVADLLAAAGRGAAAQAGAGAVRQQLAQADAEAVCSELQELLAGPQGKEALSALLHATRPAERDAPAAQSACAALRRCVAARLPGWLGGMPAGAAPAVRDCVLVAMAELEHLAPADHVGLYSGCLSALAEGRPHATAVLELVPPCLLLIPPGAPESASQGDGGGRSAADAVDGGDGAPQGTPPTEASACHRQAAVHRLLHAEWRPEQVGALLSVVREIRLRPPEAREAVRKAISCVRTAELQQLPPVLYQVLLVSAAGARVYALGKITELFDQLARGAGGRGGGGPSSVLLQVQGTVLMHISTLLKYDAALGTEWIKHLRTGGLRPSPFLLQVALAMCGVARLEGQMLQLLRRAVVAGYASEQVGTGCAWLEPERSGEGAPTGSSAEGRHASGASLEAALLQAIRQSKFAGELVVPGAITLARQLLSCPVTSPLHLVLACAADGGAVGAAAGGGRVPSQAPPNTRAVRLGLLLLGCVFEHHAEARDEVLRSCQLGATKLEACLPHVLLLSRLCAAQPALLAAHTQPLKDCLSHFAALPPEAAMALLRALWPLCRVRRELQDHVIMLLRKVMYGRDPNSRVVAIRGFIHLIVEQLKSAPPSPPGSSDEAGPSQASCSQEPLSQMSALASGGGVNLLQELAGMLRRALTQQAPVREALYSGVTQILAADPRCHELLSELLLPHLERYITPGDAVPPLALERCVAVHQLGGDPSLVEPLPALLACARRLAALQPEEGEAPPGSSEASAGAATQPPALRAERGCESSLALQRLLSGLRSRLLRGCPEDFGVSNALDLAPGSAAGRLNQMRVSALLGAIEVAVEDVVADCQLLNLRLAQDGAPPPGGARHAARCLHQLSAALAMHQRLSDLARGGAKPGGSKGKRGTATSGGGSGGQQGGAAAKAAAAKAGAEGGYVPVTARAPQLSAACLAALCNAIRRDGLLASPPGGWEAAADEDADADGGAGEPTPAASVLTGLAGGGGGGGGGGGRDIAAALSEHTQLVRDDRFRAFVLSAAANHLEAARRDAAGAALMGGGAAGGGWLVLCGPLYKLAKTIMDTATPGGRHVGPRSMGAPAAKAPKGGKGGKGSKPAATASASAASGGDAGGADGGGGAGGGETLEWLAVRALHEAVLLADASQQLGALARALLPRAGGGGGGGGGEGAGEARGQDAAGQGGGGLTQGGGSQRRDQGAPAGGDAGLVAAVAPLLRQLQGGVDSLMRTGCFKPAAAAAQTLLLLGRCLAAAETSLANAAAAAPAPRSAQQQATQAPAQPQPRQPQAQAQPQAAEARAAAAAARDASQALSDWAALACQQQEPEVTHLGLIKTLLEVHIRFSRARDDVASLALVASDIQRVVGQADTETQPTQTQGRAFPALTAKRTGQPSGAFVLAYLEEALAEVERAIAGLARGPDEGGAPAGAAAQQRMRAAVCRRLEAAAGVLDVVVNTVFAAAPIVDATVKVLTRAYRTLLAAAKLHTPPRPERGAAAAGAGGGGSGRGVASSAAAAAVTPEFVKLAAFVNGGLTPHVYAFIHDSHEPKDSDGEEAAARTTLAARISRARRDARSIPNLVFGLEAWERQLVVAGKAAKVNLLRNAKRSTNRDFKIKSAHIGGQPAPRAAAGGLAHSKGAKRRAEQEAAAPSGRPPKVPAHAGAGGPRRAAAAYGEAEGEAEAEGEGEGEGETYADGEEAYGEGEGEDEQEEGEEEGEEDDMMQEGGDGEEEEEEEEGEEGGGAYDAEGEEDQD